MAGLFTLDAEPVELPDTHGEFRRCEQRLRVAATVRGGVVYRPEEWETETREEITRRCRIRGSRQG
jgi:hypothetical protein